MVGPSPNEACAQVQGKSALILSGGGANGAYEVGVIQALCSGKARVTGYRPFRPDIITGTSIGAFNASVLAANAYLGEMKADSLRDIWVNEIPRDDSTRHNHVFRYRADPFEFFNPELAVRDPVKPFTGFARDTMVIAKDFARRASRFFQSNEGLETRLLEMVDVSTFIDVEPTRRLIEKYINPSDVLTTPIDLKIATTNWDSGELQVFCNRGVSHPVEALMTERLVPLAVLASAAIPGLFPPVQIDGVNYVDGGTVMNTPLTPAIRAGGRDLHLIYLDPNVSAIPADALLSTIDVMSRMLTILFAVAMNRDVRMAMRINRELAAFGELKDSPLARDPEASHLLERVKGRVLAPGAPELHPLSIHRYHPKDDVSGMLGMLNFDRYRIVSLIERGFRDAMNHDCDESECLLPDGAMGSGGHSREAA